MPRKPKPAIEYASAIGSAAFDLLTTYSPTEADAAIDVLWTVNPRLFSWLTERLNAVEARRLLSASPHVERRTVHDDDSTRAVETTSRPFDVHAATDDPKR